RSPHWPRSRPRDSSASITSAAFRWPKASANFPCITCEARELPLTALFLLNDLQHLGRLIKHLRNRLERRRVSRRKLNDKKANVGSCRRRILVDGARGIRAGQSR